MRLLKFCSNFVQLTVHVQTKLFMFNKNNNKQVSIPLRQIITSKKWLHQSGSGIISVNKINTSLGFIDTNKDKKHAKHQNS